MMNPQETCPSDTVTLDSLASELEELQGQMLSVMLYLSQHHNAAKCENCGNIHPRTEMLVPFGHYHGSDGVARPEASRYFCGFCADRAKWLGGNTPEVRQRIADWFASPRGTRWLKANRGPATEFLEREFHAEIHAARLRHAR